MREAHLRRSYTPSMPLRFPRRAACAPVLLIAVAACSPAGGPAGPEASEVDPDEARGADTEDELELLRMLGYTEFAEVREGEASGVVLHDVARSWRGYDLVTSVPDCTTVLLDPTGVEVRRWVVDGSDNTMRAELLPSGDLALVANELPEGEKATSSLMSVSWDGELRWRRPVNAHHDVRLAPNGELITLGSRLRPLPQLGGTCRDDIVIRYSQSGFLGPRYSLWNMVSGNQEFLDRIDEQLSRREWGTSWVELFHANSVDWMPFPELVGTHPLYGENCVLVSMRSQNTIAVFDLDLEVCLWTWGWEVLQGQHDATYLPDGTIVLFDNGNLGRGHSRILIVDPRTEEVVWTWTAPNPEDFYSEGRGTVQHLPNGNFLVGDSNSGEAFELTRDGDVVWRYRSPFVGDKGRSVLRIRRYPPELVEPLLSPSGD